MRKKGGKRTIYTQLSQWDKQTFVWIPISAKGEGGLRKIRNTGKHAEASGRRRGLGKIAAKTMRAGALTFTSPGSDKSVVDPVA